MKSAPRYFVLAFVLVISALLLQTLFSATTSPVEAQDNAATQQVDTADVRYAPATADPLVWTDLGDGAPGETVISALVADSDGTVVAGTYGTGARVFSFNTATGEFSSSVSVPGGDPVVDRLAVGTDGTIYVATSVSFGLGNLYTYDLTTNAVSHLGNIGDEYASSIAVGTDGKLYIGTCCQGRLSIYDPVAESWDYRGTILTGQRRLTGLTTAPDGMIYGVTSRIWVSPYGGAILYKYNPNTGVATTLGTIEPGRHESWNLKYNPVDGRLYGSVDYDMVPRLFSYDLANPGAGIQDMGSLNESDVSIWTDGVVIAESGRVYVLTAGPAASTYTYVYDPANRDAGLAVVGLQNGGRTPAAFATNGRLYAANGFAPTHLLRSESIVDCTDVNPAAQPVILVTGWGGGSELSTDEDLSLLRDQMQLHGYREGCNLFYVSGTSPHKFNSGNAQQISDQMCSFANLAWQSNPDWNGHFSIIAHSYGGLRSREFLEGGLYGYPDSPGKLCQTQDSYRFIRINNLFTAGTPHGGESIIGLLPFSTIIGATAYVNDEWKALLEINPILRKLNYSTSKKPEGTNYHLIAGDARAHHDELPGPLRATLRLWWWTALTPNDYAVHHHSATALAYFPEQYPGVMVHNTDDLHGDIHARQPLLDPDHVLKSYFYPGTTFEQEICPYLPGCVTTHTPSIPEQVTENNRLEQSSLQSLKQPTAQGGDSIIAIATGVLSSSETISGSFTLDEGGVSAVNFSWIEGDVILTLSDPVGQTIDPDFAIADPNTDYFDLDTGFGMLTTYYFTNTITGTWQYTFTAGSLTQPTVYGLFVTPSKPIGLSVTLPEWVPFGGSTEITATVSYSTDLQLVADTISGTVYLPNGVTTTLALVDDGAHHDGAAGDGVFGGSFDQTGQGGFYSIQLTAAGQHDGEPYVRSATVMFTVPTDDVALAGTYADHPLDRDGDGLYELLEVDVGLTVSDTATVTVSANIYAGSTFIGHAFATGLVTSGSPTVTLPFAGHDIRLKGNDGPFTVRNVILLDETEYPLLIENADMVWNTTAYDHTQFDTTLVTPAQIVVNGITEGGINESYTFSVTVQPLTTTHPITYKWTATGHPPITHTGGLTDELVLSWVDGGLVTITVEALNQYGSVTEQHNVFITVPTHVGLVNENARATHPYIIMLTLVVTVMLSGTIILHRHQTFRATKQKHR